MRTHLIQKAVRGGLLASLALALVGVSCSLDKVDVPQALVGPAELGLSLKLAANPDWVVADDVSRSDITATLRDQNGSGVAGRTIVFAIQNEAGTYVALGQLSSPTAVTDGGGNARISYYAPARRDQLSDAFVYVAARPSSDDAGGQQLRRVKIQIVPSERPLFAPAAGCGIITQPAVGPETGGAFKTGSQVLFQAAYPVGTVRFEWLFPDDGSYDFKPDVEHTFYKAGDWTVTLSLTNKSATVTSCTRTISVIE
jgi:hypothetical protein